MKQRNRKVARYNLAQLNIRTILCVIQREVRLPTHVNNICNPKLHKLALENATRNLVNSYKVLGDTYVEENMGTKAFIRAVRKLEAQRLAI